MRGIGSRIRLYKFFPAIAFLRKTPFFLSFGISLTCICVYLEMVGWEWLIFDKEKKQEKAY